MTHQSASLLASLMGLVRSIRIGGRLVPSVTLHGAIQRRKVCRIAQCRVPQDKPNRKAKCVGRCVDLVSTTGCIEVNFCIYIGFFTMVQWLHFLLSFTICEAEESL